MFCPLSDGILNKNVDFFNAPDGVPTDHCGAIFGDNIIQESDGETEQSQRAQMRNHPLEGVHNRAEFPLISLCGGLK